MRRIGERPQGRQDGHLGGHQGGDLGLHGMHGVHEARRQAAGLAAVVSAGLLALFGTLPVQAQAPTRAAAAAASASAPAPVVTEPSSPAKKELVARLLKLHQPGLENLGRQLAEQPALQMGEAVRAALARLPQDRREAVARQIQADMQRYAEDAVPIVRDKAVALAPATLGPMLEQRFTEDELRQLVAILESPLNARYQALGVEMQRALGMKLVAETRPAIDPKVKALEQAIQGRLRAAAPTAASPGAGPGPAAPASGAAGSGLRLPSGN